MNPSDRTTQESGFGFSSSGEPEGLQLIGVLTFGNEFRAMPRAA